MSFLSPHVITRLSRLTAPSYSLTVNSLVPNPALQDRLTSLSVTLNNGKTSDQLSLSFDDRPGLMNGGLSLPSPGLEIKVAMGYEAYKAEMGAFLVNQIGLSGSGGGRSITVSATPDLLLRQVTRTWSDDNSINDIIGAIAAEHGLEAAVSPSFMLKKIDTMNQLNESNAAFLTRLAAHYNAVCKPMAGKLLFMEKGQGTSATGLPMLAIPIRPHDVLQWSKQTSRRQDYTKVVAYWPELLNGSYGMVCHPSDSVSTTDDVYRLPHLYSSEEEALEAAKSKYDEINRDDDTISLTVIGNPDITAEGKIIISDLRSEVDGEYIVQSATHSFSGGGYQTTVRAYVEP